MVADLSARTGSRRSKLTVRPVHRRSANQCLAGLAAGFLPVASYVVAHYEAPAEPALYALVLCALGYSAPTLATWAQRWAGHIVKAWGFTVLLEGVMVLSHIRVLALTGLGILVLINSVTAYSKSK